MSAFLALLTLASFVAPSDRTPVTYEPGNIKLTYPKVWQKLKSPNDLFPLAFGRGGILVFVSATETNVTREELVSSYDEEQKLRVEFMKILRKQEIAVAGEKASVVEMEVKETGILHLVMFTAFTHQGIAYRFVGVRALGNIKQFKEDYYSILDSVEFLKERKDWLARFEGKPAKMAMLGGLVRFELNRPRWTESTFDNQRDYAALDQIDFKYLAGGAWITIAAREAHGDAAIELANLTQELANGLKNPKTTAVDGAGRVAKIPVSEISGAIGEDMYTYRAAVFVEEGIVAQLSLQCAASQRENTQRDWQQLLKSFHLQRKSKPVEPIAFELGRRDSQGPPADPGVAAVLEKATRLLAFPAQSQVVGISPDGSHALIQIGQALTLENLATHKREALPASIVYGYGQPVAWSRDGKRLAFGAGSEIVVVGLDGKEPRRFAGGALHLSFAPAGDALLISTRNGEHQYPQARRFFTSRLERLNLATGKKSVLVDFPLGRVTHPALSPDGKRLALVCNRDYPRSANIGGHLYVAAADGTGLKQLTREPEGFVSVAWSDDGKWLTVVRRLAVGQKGEVGIGGPQDLYGVSPDTGQAVNLTRCGKVFRHWSCGPHLFFDVNAWDVPESQRGLFRINAEDLARATASRPAPQASDLIAFAKAAATKVRAALTPHRPEEVVLTPAILEKVSQAFAQAAEQTLARRLDFTAASLRQLRELASQLTLLEDRDPAVLFGLGAYYGETLRKTAGAEWKLKPVRFGERSAASGVAGNALVQVVLPFGEASFRGGEDDEPAGFYDWTAARSQGQKLILVYPPGYAAEAVRQATTADFLKAMNLLDAGEVRPALDLMTREMQRQPRNAALAREVFAVCEAARLPDLARELAGQAVAAGNEVPELLISHAEKVSKTDPRKALALLRKAVKSDYPSADSYLKLGRQYASLNQMDLAEACYRQAYWVSNETQKREVRQLLGLPLVEATASDDREAP